VTEFTDDLDNNLELLAEHHDVTPAQVAKVAFAQMPKGERLSLLLVMLESLPDGLRRALDRPVAEVASAIDPSAKLPLARALSRSTSSQQEDPEVLSPHTGLPQKLRGAIHELTRRYPINLIVDAAMLETDDEVVREAIARAFLPKERKEQERKPEVRRYELLDADNCDVLWSGTEPFQPMKFDYVAADGSVRGYQREGHMAFEFGPGVEGITGQTYYRSLESLAEESEEKAKTLREKLGLVSTSEPKPEPLFTFVAESARGAVLGKANEALSNIRIINGLTGRSESYTLKRVVPEYDFREDENAPQVRQLAVYSKDGGQ
jgi:hypothetical protein